VIEDFEMLRSARLLQPTRGRFILKLQRQDGSVERYRVSVNDVCDFVADGADMAFRHREEMS
jgi:hypothetical protein